MNKEKSVDRKSKYPELNSKEWFKVENSWSSDNDYFIECEKKCLRC